MTNGVHLSRRRVLGLAAGLGLTLPLAAPGAAHASAPRTDAVRELAALERRHGARLGVFAYNNATDVTVRYRADELFPICSVFKGVAVAAVMRDLDRNGSFLARRIRYSAADVTRAGYAPVTGTPENLANGLTVAELCAAAVTHSDNAAANLLLGLLGGPTAITRFCRSIGDPRTRLDRWEPELNSAEPHRRTDTTSPRAIAHTYTRLALGTALSLPHRRLLNEWLLANTTGGARLRAGLPPGWTIGEKTGTGDYGTANDVGIARAPAGPPLVIAVLTRHDHPDATPVEPLIAQTAALLAAALG